MRFAGKVALVTGAGSGIGRAVALAFAREGARVAASDIDQDAAEATAAAICDAGGAGEAHAHDVALEESWTAVIEAVLRAHGRIDVLVNNAGVALGGPLADTTLEDWRWVMSINLDGAFLGVKHALRAMRRTGGAIVNVSSATGLVGRPLSGAVSASKAGVRLLTKTAALECAARGERIRVNSVHPGGVDTAIFQGQGWWPNHRHRSREQEARADIVSDTPLGRLADPDEIAAAILFLASDEASFVTGAELVVDGGFTAA